MNKNYLLFLILLLSGCTASHPSPESNYLILNDAPQECVEDVIQGDPEYNSLLRNTIQERVYLSYLSKESGSVHFCFDVGPDGELRTIRVIKNKTQASDKLLEDMVVALKSSAPFPPFPEAVKEKLKDPDKSLSFNLDLQFEVINETSEIP